MLIYSARWSSLGSQGRYRRQHREQSHNNEEADRLRGSGNRGQDVGKKRARRHPTLPGGDGEGCCVAALLLAPGRAIRRARDAARRLAWSECFESIGTDFRTKVRETRCMTASRCEPSPASIWRSGTCLMATTLLKFRRLLIEHELTRKLFDENIT